MHGENETERVVRQALPYGRIKIARSIYIIFTILHYYNTTKTAKKPRCKADCFCKISKTTFFT